MALMGSLSLLYMLKAAWGPNGECTFECSSAELPSNLSVEQHFELHTDTDENHGGEWGACGY